jgi:hypothetical protein
MSMDETDAEQKAEMPELDLWGSGRNPRGHRKTSASNATVETESRTGEGQVTMEAIVARDFNRGNRQSQCLKTITSSTAVIRNRTSGGVGGGRGQARLLPDNRPFRA